MFYDYKFASLDEFIARNKVNDIADLIFYISDEEISHLR